MEGLEIGKATYISIEWTELLGCPSCTNMRLKLKNGNYHCLKCKLRFSITWHGYFERGEKMYASGLEKHLDELHEKNASSK